MKREDKEYAKNIVVAGYNEYNQLGVNPNNKGGDYTIVHPPQNLPIEPSSLLSYYAYCYHSVIITWSGSHSYWSKKARNKWLLKRKIRNNLVKLTLDNQCAIYQERYIGIRKCIDENEQLLTNL